VDQPAEGLLGLAGPAIGALVHHRRLTEAEPASQPGDKSIPLGKLIELFDNAAIHQAEDARIGRAGQISHGAQQRIEEAESDSARAVTVASTRSLPQNHLVALAPFGHQLGNDLRRVLQIAVDQDDALAAGVVDARRHRRLMPEIAREADDLESPILGVHLPQQLRGAVAAAVVHENDLPHLAAAINGGKQPPPQLRQALLLIEDRHDDRNHPAAIIPPPPHTTNAAHRRGCA
jgi:hypothetical protein